MRLVETEEYLAEPVVVDAPTTPVKLRTLLTDSQFTEGIAGVVVMNRDESGNYLYLTYKTGAVAPAIADMDRVPVDQGRIFRMSRAQLNDVWIGGDPGICKAYISQH